VYIIDSREVCRERFLAAASATGKPRGLAWKQCDLQDGLLLARDRATGELLALVGATISFAAIEGGGMEDVEAVGNLRAATAIFSWTGREWTTQGRAVFNLEPREVLERSGIPVGVVTKAEKGQDLFKTIVVRPSIDFGSIEEVIVLHTRKIPNDVVRYTP